DLRFSVREFTDEGCLVAALPPRFREVCADGSRTASNLVGQGVSFFLWKCLRQFKYRHGYVKRLAEDFQVPMRLNIAHGPRPVTLSPCHPVPCHLVTL